MNDKQSYERYQRQLILPGFGEAAQQKLLEAKVLIIGAGGLGCPVLQYVAAAGVGTIGIVDDDVVQLNNLQRQVLFTVDDIGHSKGEKAAAVLQKLNPDCRVLAFNQRVFTKNALQLFREYDVIIDATDNFPTRYLINDACYLLKKPLVYGSISRFEGQVAVFNNQSAKDVNYRDIFPAPPKDGEVMNCAEAGVLGVLGGIIGSMMANETIKLITGIGNPLVNRLYTYHALKNQVYEISLAISAEGRALLPRSESDFMKMDYVQICSPVSSISEIDAQQFDEWIGNASATIIDVREMQELPEVVEFIHTRIPLWVLADRTGDIKSDTVITFCQTGKRSLHAAGTLQNIFGDTKKVYSLRGGILQWKKQHQPV